MGVAHGLGLLYELALMEAAGLPPIAVINAATGASAGRLGYKEDFGQIKPGFRSRFILTTHAPLTSVTHLNRDKYVIYDGAVYHDSGERDVAGL
jgi:imidazolonepropionase-like amidohydrolase